MSATEQGRALAEQLAAEVYDRWANGHAGFLPIDRCDEGIRSRAIDCVLAGLAASRDREREVAKAAWNAALAYLQRLGFSVNTMAKSRDRYLDATYPPTAPEVVPPEDAVTAIGEVLMELLAENTLNTSGGVSFAKYGVERIRVALAAVRTEGK